nr:immunoglobulin heavy chain junction region [Macaca mulatta]
CARLESGGQTIDNW